MYHGFILSLNYRLEEGSEEKSKQVYIKRHSISKLIDELAQFDGRVTEDGRTVQVEDWFISEVLYSSERKNDDE